MSRVRTISNTELAKIFGVTKRRLEQLAANGTIVRAARGTYDYDASVTGYTQFLRDSANQVKVNNASPEQVAFKTERTKILAIDRRAKEMRVAREAGELLGREDVVDTWASNITMCKNRMREIPKKAVSRIPGFTRAMAKPLTEMINEALDELAGNGVPQRTDGGRRVARRR